MSGDVHVMFSAASRSVAVDGMDNGEREGEDEGEYVGFCVVGKSVGDKEGIDDGSDDGEELVSVEGRLDGTTDTVGVSVGELTGSGVRGKSEMTHLPISSQAPRHSISASSSYSYSSFPAFISLTSSSVAMLQYLSYGAGRHVNTVL